MPLIRATLATASSVLLLATLAACGGGDPTAADAPEGPSLRSGGNGPGGGQLPGASGKVAAVAGSTAQVQNAQSGQVAVTWTATTTFDQQVAAAGSDVAVGSCVVVTPVQTDQSSTSDQSDGPVAAAAVRIQPAATDGTCTLGGPGGTRPQGMPSGRPTDLPSDLPSNLPSGAPDGVRRGGFGAAGKVTAVSATGFTVEATAPGDPQGDPQGESQGDSQAAGQTREVEVTTSSDTTYTTTAKTTAAAVKVGRCVTARGQSDATGAVTATDISVSDPVDGECGGGFMMRGPGGGNA